MQFSPKNLFPLLRDCVYVVLKKDNIDGMENVKIEGVYDSFYDANEIANKNNYSVKGPFRIKKSNNYKLPKPRSLPFVPPNPRIDFF